MIPKNFVYHCEKIKNGVVLEMIRLNGYIESQLYIGKHKFSNKFNTIDSSIKWAKEIIKKDKL